MSSTWFEQEFVPIIDNWVRLSGPLDWIDDLSQLIAEFYSKRAYLTTNYKLAVFQSKSCESDQKIMLFNVRRERSIEWFNIRERELIHGNNDKDMVCVKNITAKQLKSLGFDSSQIAEDEQKDTTYVVLLKVSGNKKESKALLFGENEQIFSWDLPQFNQITSPNQLLFQSNIGLIAFDLYNFSLCEYLRCNGVASVKWKSFPQFDSPLLKINTGFKSRYLCSAEICQMGRKGWDEFSKDVLVVCGCNGHTLMFDWGLYEWTTLPTNGCNQHNMYAYMYQWEARNNGSIVVLNGIAQKSVSEFDLHKHGWYKLPPTNYCHYQAGSTIRSGHVFENKETGLLSVMSYRTNVSPRAVIEVLDHRENLSHRAWKVLTHESQMLETLLPFNIFMSANETHCCIFG
ncbi:hypothetical protein RFI_27373 [Reticulomyxa filosa]|uniref:Uncharacterized protein n=1 Tax=Reticulomyxa filosa TaxID=46433 RepID=X6M7W7_RETFI|nr:hypothetical protein RFI_27373 [Reticulomyxa filosa]|eukprot:ETO10004.1 hypothetical protein RFI_27373 [Reticulomyxa filosa]